MGIHKGIRHKINAAHFQKPHQPVDIGIIIGMHGRGMARRDLIEHLHFVGPRRQRFQALSLIHIYCLIYIMK